MNELLAGTAVVLGTGQLLLNMREAMTSDEMSGDVTSVLMGVVASFMWMLYQFRSGANYSGVYTSAGLVVQVYILYRLLLTKKKTHSRM
jgi:hypothetical protein